MSSAPNQGPAIGAVIAGRYEIVRLLGAGGMGAVYQARQLSMDRLVALKLIHPHIASDDVAKRFHREMQATSKIEHPNTIRVFDYGVAEDGQLFLAMEFLDGRPLSKLLSEHGALPLDRIVHIAAQVTRALAAAHQDGITHRDLKPDNIMLVDRYGEQDVVKVLDFGIARFVDADQARTQVTRDGAVIGTPAYMSPEQALGHAVDHRADFYSLGVMLYQMAVGRTPFDGPTLAALLVAHATEAPAPPSTIAPVAAPLEALILRLLAKSPAERPSTAAEVLQALEACREAARAQPTAAAMPAAPQPPPVGPKPSRAPIVIVIGLAVLAGAGVVVARLARRPSAAATKAATNAATDAAARARLDALQLADGDPLAPVACRASDGALVDRLARAAAFLADSTVGKPRPQDRDALTLLSTLKGADGAAEYWALLSRARLVIEPAADGALEAARTAVARCPGYALAHNLAGNAEQRAKHPEAAAAAYHEALKSAPDYLAPRFNLGLLSLRAGDAKSAIAAFDEVLQKNPVHPRAYLARGQAHLLVGDVRAALDDLEQATLRHPEQAEAWLLLGQARGKAKLEKGARDAFCKAKALGSDEGARLCP
jgi:tetratricopeptide (TPR) repeat protein/predicted Ser/Thr protein kinase